VALLALETQKKGHASGEEATRGPSGENKKTPIKGNQRHRQKRFGGCRQGHSTGEGGKTQGRINSTGPAEQNAVRRKDKSELPLLGARRGGTVRRKRGGISDRESMGGREDLNLQNSRRVPAI